RGGQCSCKRAACPKPAKHPHGLLAPHGFKDGTTDEQMIHRWWREVPDANIGLVLERLLVIDLDSKAAQREAHGLGLPSGPVAVTAWGHHHYYRAPAGLTGSTTHRGRSRAIDVLANGHIVAPPSLHSTGIHYRWAMELDHSQLVHAPAWDVAWLSAPPAPVSGPASLPPTLPQLDINTVAISPRLHNLIRNGHQSQSNRY